MPVIMVAVHLCGGLSCKAVEIFNASPNVRNLILKPCCLPGRQAVKQELDWTFVNGYTFSAKDLYSPTPASVAAPGPLWRDGDRSPGESCALAKRNRARRSRGASTPRPVQSRSMPALSRKPGPEPTAIRPWPGLDPSQPADPLPGPGGLAHRSREGAPCRHRLLRVHLWVVIDVPAS